MIVYDLETFNTERAVLYVFGLYKLSKISGKNCCDRTQREYENVEMILLFSNELIALILF